MRKTVDLRGLVCPEPILRAKNLLDNMTVESIEALVDDEVNVNNLERLARFLKREIVVRSEANYFRVVIGRSTDQAESRQNGDDHLHNSSQLSLSVSKEAVGTVVFLSKQTLGEGEEGFSVSLMNLFLQTLFETGQRPRAILLVNSAVKLLASQAATVKVLNDFRENGCEVLACGLCLEFYGLKEKVPKEQITNMFAICEFLCSADKVLSP